jgi:hypothetical protein
MMGAVKCRNGRERKESLSTFIRYIIFYCTIIEGYTELSHDFNIVWIIDSYKRLALIVISLASTAKICLFMAF